MAHRTKKIHKIILFHFTKTNDKSSWFVDEPMDCNDYDENEELMEDLGLLRCC